VVRLETGMNGIGRHLAALECEKHAGRKEWIEKRERVADQTEPIAANLLRVIRVLAGDPDGLHLFGVLHVVVDPRTRTDFARKDLIGIARVAVEIPGFADDTDRQDVRVLRDIPEPAL